MSKLFIKGVNIPLGLETNIVQTKQVNDLFSLNTRQTNITNSFKIPKTGEVLKAFEFLGVSGNISSIPYTINKASYYSDEGECFIYKGRALITESGNDYFNCQLIDGNIDIYKAIENKKISELPIEEINHVKTVANIVASWNEERKYKYIVADYNGKAFIEGTKLNADYLIPSVPISYIWEKIFQHYGFTFEGDIFNDVRFRNMYITFPNGIASGTSSTVMFNSDDYYFTNVSPLTTINGIRLPYMTADINLLTSTYNNAHYEVPEDGTYKVSVSGYLSMDKPFFNLSLGKNQEGQGVMNTQDIYDFGNIENYTEFSKETTLDLVQGDSINLRIKRVTEAFRFRLEEENRLTFNITKVVSENVDFVTAFSELDTKDFFNEIINRFALVPIKDKYSNVYRFYTFDQILSKENAYDWSNKFDSVTRENYIYGSYAQRNLFRYKYNDLESDYNDGFIDISNANLEAKKDAFVSKIYSPEKVKTFIFDQPSNVYKIWEKEVKDDGSVNYKSLDKRFYFLRSNNVFSDVEKTIKSEYDLTEETFTNYPKESFYEMDFDTIINNFYRNLGSILNRAVVKNCKFFLNNDIVSNLDFSKIVFVKQLGGWNIINKITNFTGKGIANIELIAIDFSIQDTQPEPEKVIESIIQEFEGDTIFVFTIIYNSNFFDSLNVSILVNGNLHNTVVNDGNVEFNIYGVTGDDFNLTLKHPTLEIYSETVNIIFGQ